MDLGKNNKDGLKFVVKYKGEECIMSYGMNMDCGMGKFVLGMALGTTIGAAIGMTVAPSQRQIRRAAHNAAKKVSEAVDALTEAMDM